MTRLVRADNPGPMTLEGTNTWLVGRRRVLVVDPGPADADHVTAVLAAVGRDGGVLGGVLLTHRHHDHADAVPLLAGALVDAGAHVLAADPALGLAPDPPSLAAATDEPVRLLPLPGHTDDSVGLVLPARREVLTGDTVLGRGTSVVAHPDGDLGAYLASLRALLSLTEPTGTTDRTGTTDPTVTLGAPWRGLPGHGPVVDDLAGAVAVLHEHRLARLEQVRAALARLGVPGGAPRATAAADDEVVAAVVAAVYPGLADPVLVHAATRTVRATLVHLAGPDQARS